MKKKKSKMKRRLSLLIATVLAAGVAVPALVKSVTEVKADTTEPSVEYFAEANELEQLKNRVRKADEWQGCGMVYCRQR